MATLAADETVPGFVAPVHRALTEPILLGGAPRAVAILNGTLAAALGLGLVYFWLEGHLLQFRENGRGFLFFLAAALCLLLVSFFRQDEPAPFWNGMRLDILESTLLSLACLAAGLAAWVKFERKVS